MKLKHTKKTTISVEYGDLEKLIDEVYDMNYQFVAEQEANNYSSYEFTVPNKYAKTSTHSPSSPSAILDQLYKDGHIEAGNYVIHVSW